jgi:inner membrane protein
MNPTSNATRLALKLVLIGVLTVVLWIPTLMILVLVEERSARQTEVQTEIQQTWGGPQTVAGPFLVVPIDQPSRNVNGEAVVTASEFDTRFVLPAELMVSASVEPEIRKRSIFQTVVYRSEIRIRGRFDVSDWIEPSSPHRWDRAELVIGISDLRGLSSLPTVTSGGRDLVLEASAREELTGAALSVSLDEVVPELGEGGVIPFEMVLHLRGGESLDLVPVGGETTLTMASEWPDPSFSGAFLPTERTVEDDGFEAKWQVLHLNRDFPQSWIGARSGDHRMRCAFNDAAFGVRLLPGIDAYARISRALKYSGIFTLLTLMAFFAVEHGSGGRVHPIQYGVVGLGLCLFYLTLLALAEISPFDLAFGAAAVVIVAFIGSYARAVLRRGRDAGVATGVLVMVYAALFVMLRLEDLALLMGTVLLLLLLGVVMRLTTRLNRDDA